MTIFLFDYQKVSKEVKKLRNYEQSLLSAYQKYINILEDHLKGT